MNTFEKKLNMIGENGLYSEDTDILQVNVGLKCNQNCSHCHLMASPKRNEMMEWKTMQSILDVIEDTKCNLVDITGGAPELNPHFERFIEELVKRNLNVQVRTNLSVLLESGREKLFDFFYENKIKIVASLPCYLQENVCMQRGEGVYEKSIKAIKKLNSCGYGTNASLPLRLVYNPGGPFLPPNQSELEDEYRRELNERFDISFTNLLTITNMPIGRFLNTLKQENQLIEYMDLLKNSFNPNTMKDLMCRHQISVGWDGTLFDCDFNLALGFEINHGAPNHISSFDVEKLSSRRIVTGNHCFGCTAGAGSSCAGALL